MPSPAPLFQSYRLHLQEPLGSISLDVCADGLLALHLVEARSVSGKQGFELERASPESSAKERAAMDALAKRAHRCLERYCATGKLRDVPPIKMRGTAFQQEVWRELCRVGAGESLSYGELAERAGYPGASRAVGGAMARNPLPVFVPCHRVLAASGKLGGFTGGLETKQRLLAHEGHPAFAQLFAVR